MTIHAWSGHLNSLDKWGSRLNSLNKWGGHLNSLNKWGNIWIIAKQCKTMYLYGNPLVSHLNSLNKWGVIKSKFKSLIPRFHTAIVIATSLSLSLLLSLYGNELSDSDSSILHTGHRYRYCYKWVPIQYLVIATSISLLLMLSLSGNSPKGFPYKYIVLQCLLL